MRTLFLFLALFFHSCSSNQTLLHQGKDLLTIKQTALKPGYFLKHFELVEIIPIQNCDTCLIANIKKVIRHKDKIILLSGKNNTVFVLSAVNGKIEKTINKVGRGPGESMTILDIAFDEKAEQILIYNDYSKLLTFDFVGNFLSETKIDGLYEGIYCQNGHVVFYNKLEGYSFYPHHFKILNLVDNTIKKIDDDRKVDFPIRGMGKYMVKSKQIWFTSPLDFNFYTYQENELLAPFELDFPSNPNLDESLLKKAISKPQEFLEYVAQNNLIYSVNSIRETEDYLVFRTNQEGIFMVDKSQKEVYKEEFIAEKALPVKIRDYFPHDGDDSKIMFILSPATIIAEAGRYKVSDYNVNEGDNPILLFYRQKNVVQ